MEIERTLREAFAMREAPADFEEVVMARVSAAAWRAGQRGSRGIRRIVLMSAVFVMVSAAAMLMAWRTDPPDVPPVVKMQAATAAVPPLNAQFSPPPPAPELLPHAPGPQHPPVSTNDICAQAAATRAPPAYSVQLQPLQFETDDPAVQPGIREYYEAMLEQLKLIPGLVLAAPGGAGIEGKPADYRLTLIGLPGAVADASTQPQRWQVRQLVEKRQGSSFERFTDSTLRFSSFSCVGPDGAECSMAQKARANVTYLQLPSYPTAAQATCSRARAAERPPTQPPVAAASMAIGFIDRLAGKEPAGRTSSLGLLRNLVKPEMVPALVAALHESTDDTFRGEIVSLLAAKFPDDPAAREALAVVATANAGTLQGHVAQRALTGEGPWRDYTIASIRDASLPAAKRLEPLSWMVEAMTLEPANEASAIDLLATLQQDGGEQALSQLLAGVVQAGVDGGMANFQQGQLVMRKLGALKHPAAVTLLIDCYDAIPNGTTLNILASRRDDPRVTSKLEAIAGDPSNPALAKRATSLLSEPPKVPSTPPTGPFGPNGLPLPPPFTR
jgi:hypothetical protein